MEKFIGCIVLCCMLFSGCGYINTGYITTVYNENGEVVDSFICDYPAGRSFVYDNGRKTITYPDNYLLKSRKMDRSERLKYNGVLDFGYGGCEYW